jgi:hypothetical protein
MVPPCTGSIRVLILRASRGILQAVVPLPLVEFPSQVLGMSYLFLGLSLNLFSGLLRWFTALFHHVDLSMLSSESDSDDGRQIGSGVVSGQPGCDRLYPRRDLYLSPLSSQVRVQVVPCL